MWQQDLDRDGGFADASGGVVSHVYDEAGTYTVTLRVTDALGYQDEAEHTVTVKEGKYYIFMPLAISSGS